MASAEVKGWREAFYYGLGVFAIGVGATLLLGWKIWGEGDAHKAIVVGLIVVVSLFGLSLGLLMVWRSAKFIRIDIEKQSGRVLVDETTKDLKRRARYEPVMGAIRERGRLEDELAKARAERAARQKEREQLEQARAGGQATAEETTLDDKIAELDARIEACKDDIKQIDDNLPALADG